MGMYESGGPAQPNGTGCVWSTELRAWVVERDGRRLRFDDALRRWVDVGPSAVAASPSGGTMRLTDAVPTAGAYGPPPAGATQNHGYVPPSAAAGKTKGLVLKLSAAFVALVVVGFGSFRVAGAIGGDGPPTTVAAAPQPPTTPPTNPPDDGKDKKTDGNGSGDGCRKGSDQQQDLIPAGANPNVPRTSPTTSPKSSTTTKPRTSCPKKDDGSGTDSDPGKGSETGMDTDSGKGNDTDTECGHDARMRLGLRLRLTADERTTTTRRPKTSATCGTAPKTTDTTDTRPRILVAAVDASTGDSVSGNWKITLKSVSTGQSDESNEPNSPGAVWRVKPGRYSVEFTPPAGYVVVDDGGKPHAGVTVTVTVSSGDELIKIRVARG